jgi:hypothetical protein
MISGSGVTPYIGGAKQNFPAKNNYKYCVQVSLILLVMILVAYLLLCFCSATKLCTLAGLYMHQKIAFVVVW